MRTKRFEAALLSGVLAASVVFSVPSAAALETVPSAAALETDAQFVSEICIEEATSAGALTYFAVPGVPVFLESDLINLDPDSLELVSQDGQNVTGWSIQYWDAYNPPQLVLVVPKDAPRGETFNLSVHARTVKGQPVELPEFTVSIPGIRGGASGNPGEKVLIETKGFPSGTEFTLTDKWADEGWKLERSGDGNHYLVIPQNAQRGSLEQVEIEASYSCAPRPQDNNIGEYSGSEIFTIEIRIEKESDLWWLMLIPAGGLIVWGISKLINQQVLSSSIPGMPGQPGESETPKTPDAPKTPETPNKPETPGESEDLETPAELGTPSAPDAPREVITSVPSGATVYEAGMRSYI